MNTIFPLAALTLLALTSTNVAAQSVTVLHGSDDAQECSAEARLASSHYLPGSVYNASACTRALEDPGIYSTKDQAALHINRGIILAAREDYQAAFQDYKTAFEIKPDLPETYVNLGNLYFLGGNFEKAIEFYDQSLALDIRKNHVVFLNRGMAHQKLGRFQQAENDFRQALTLVPEWPLAENKLANLLGETEE